MSDYNTFVVVDCNKRLPVLVTSSARKAYKIFCVGKRIEVWNDNQLIKKFLFKSKDKKLFVNYISLEKNYIKRKQKNAYIRNKNRICNTNK